MLKTKKSITLTGTVTVKEGETEKQVVYLNANISRDSGNDNISQTIQDKALYAANKVEIRKDVAEFTKEVYHIQDQEVTE